MPNKLAIAFIGTGSMGEPMVFNLLEKGYPVKVYDKYKAAAEEVIARGAVWADTAREAAIGSDIVITCLPLPQHLLENILGEDGALAGMKAGDIWIDTSTTDYHKTLYIAGIAAEKGVLSLEAPVSNLSHMGVDFTNTSFYVGGDQAGYDRSKEVLHTIGRKSYYVGEIGAAQTVKLLTNLLFFGSIVTYGEALCLAHEANIPLYWMWEFVRQSKGNSVAVEQFSPFLFDGSYDNSCSLEIVVKDMSLAIALADELDVALPIGRVINESFAKADEWYDGQENELVVIKVNEVQNNLELRIPGFIAPSKYGANPDYVCPEEYVEDEYGRIKPKLPDSYKSPPYQLEASQIELAQTLSDFMAYVNFVVLEEAYQVGRQMGLSQALLLHTIRWSVGSCWVADHYDSFQPADLVLDKMAAIETKLELPAIRKMLSIFIS